MNEWTKYRYYSDEDIVYLNTIKALQSMGLPLIKIKDLIHLQDFNKIVDLLKQAEISADKKIIELNETKQKIERAKTFYETKLCNKEKNNSQFVQIIPERVILISNKLSEPTVSNLYNYHRHYYEQVVKKEKASLILKIKQVFTKHIMKKDYSPCVQSIATTKILKFYLKENICAQIVMI